MHVQVLSGQHLDGTATRSSRRSQSAGTGARAISSRIGTGPSWWRWNPVCWNSSATSASIRSARRWCGTSAPSIGSPGPATVPSSGRSPSPGRRPPRSSDTSTPRRPGPAATIGSLSRPGPRRATGPSAAGAGPPLVPHYAAMIWCLRSVCPLGIPCPRQGCIRPQGGERCDDRLEVGCG